MAHRPRPAVELTACRFRGIGFRLSKVIAVSDASGMTLWMGGRRDIKNDPSMLLGLGNSAQHEDTTEGVHSGRPLVFAVGSLREIGACCLATRAWGIASLMLCVCWCP